MEFYSQQEKIKICTDIVKNLKEFENEKGCVNLYNENYSFVKPLKEIFKN